MQQVSCRFSSLVIITGLSLSSFTAVAQSQDSFKSNRSANLIPREWATKVELTDFRETPRYDETVAFCKKLAGASPMITYRSYGTSPEGRDMPLVIASRDGEFDPVKIRASGRLIVFVQNAIHAGECAGKDASLMLLRDIAITKQHINLLDRVVLIVVPIFNVDGHERFSAYSRINQNGPAEMGWRVTSQNLNLNRDYLKADTPEMRAWLKLWNTWLPDFHFDNHTTDGGDWQYDVLFDADTHATADPNIASWLSDTLYPHLFSSLEQDGYHPMIYFNMRDSRDITKGIRSRGFGPRFSTGYVSLRNRPSILVEMHALKPYRVRVLGNYQIMVNTLELLNRDPSRLQNANRQADLDSAKLSANSTTDKPITLSVRTTDKETPITFKGFAFEQQLSDISGTIRIQYDNQTPQLFDISWQKDTEPDITVTIPQGYLIPPQWTEAIDRVRLHGLKAFRLREPITLEVESYRFSEIKFPTRPFENHFMPRYKSELIRETRSFRTGSVWVPLNQPGAKIAVHLLEPEAPDSLVRWGFFNAIFEQKEYADSRVLEVIARQMLADPDHPDRPDHSDHFGLPDYLNHSDLSSLRREFEEKIRTDRDFAASPRARLNFFYHRTPWWDDRLNLYPIARINKPLTAKLVPLHEKD